MESPQTLRHLCFNETGVAKPKDECRASIINHLILEIGLGVDEAEDLADKTLRESGLWPIPDFMRMPEDGNDDNLSTISS